MPEDRAVPQAQAMRRYRCRDIACGWEGLLVRAVRIHGSARRASRDAARGTSAGAAGAAAGGERGASARAAWIATAALLLATVAVAATIVWARHLPVPFVAGGRVVPQGESYFGDRLPASHPLLARAAVAAKATVATPPGAAPAALSYRQRCAWGEPGRNPYRGSIEQALAAARLPAYVARQLAAQIRARQAIDRVAIRNEGIIGTRTQRLFDPQRVALTFGESICVGSRVHFQPGHVEWADLYEASDAAGHRWSVMLPDVCGNISLLHAKGGDANALQAGGDADFGDSGDGAGFTVTSADQFASIADVVRTVAEPSTLGCALGGLGAMALAQRWQRRPPRTG
jgi:hypothetical protein